MNSFCLESWRSLFLFLFVLLAGQTAFAQTLASRFEQPNKYGVYVMDLKNGKLQNIGGFYDWKLSPDGRYMAVGTEISKPGGSSAYAVYAVTLSNNKRQLLTSFRYDPPPFGADLRWSPDSRLVTVITGDDDREKTQNFTIKRDNSQAALRIAPKPQRRLAATATKQLKQKFSYIGDITFSDDGKWVAAYCSKGSYDKPNYLGGLWVFRPDGSDLKQVARNVSIQKSEFQDRDVRWVPGTYKLAFRRTMYEDEGI